MRKQLLEEEIEEKQLLAALYGKTQGPSVYSLALLQKSRRFLGSSCPTLTVAQLSAYENFTIYLLIHVAKFGLQQAALDGAWLKAQMINQGYDGDIISDLALLQGIGL